MGCYKTSQAQELRHGARMHLLPAACSGALKLKLWCVMMTLAREPGVKSFALGIHQGLDSSLAEAVKPGQTSVLF